MKNKVLILSVLFGAFVLFGFAVNSNLFSDLNETPGYQGSPMSPLATGDSCFGAGQELHDDRSFESGGGWNATALDGRIAVKFRPASYPWKYNKLCLPLTKNAGADSLVYDILIYDSTGVGGGPGVMKDSVIGVVARLIPNFAVYTWYASDISAKNGTLVNSGCIWIAIRWNASINSAAGKFIAYDNSAATPVWPSMYSANGAAWANSNVAWPTYKAFGLRTMGQTPPPPVAGDSVLVITNDSVLATNLAIRKADKDTLSKYLPMLTSKIRYITKDTNSTLPSLSNYGTIIVQETAFDAILARGLSNPQRTAIKTWLGTGTPSAKKSLLLIGGDIGYNYDRSANPFTDTVFSRTFGGFQYLSDNAAPTGFNSVVNIATGDADPILTTAGNYYPDGCRPVSGGTAWQRYLNRSATDSVSGIGKVGANWVVATIFQDPRYFTGSGGAGASDIGFKRVLKAALSFLKSNNGTLTGVTPTTTIADKYSLSQNYPNPFNPTTKITFAIPTTGFVTLKVYNVMGQEVMTLVNQNMTNGVYAADFNGAALSSGAYFYRLEAGSFVETKKMLLVK